MIVPRSRLLVWVALVVVPASVVATAHPTGAFLPGLAALGLSALATLDALLACRRLRGVRVLAPDVVRLTKGREGSIDLRIRNDSGEARKLRLALEFPPEITASAEILEANLPSGGDSFHLAIPCTAERRGSYPLERCHLESASWMGFWAARAFEPLAAEIRVYPDLLSERNSLGALFLNRGGFGVHTHRQTGKGREFEKLREYVPGDSYEDIHWKATARRGHPITKVFQVERTQEVYVIIDASRLSTRRPSNKDSAERFPPTILERYVTSALVLGLAAERQGDLFGIVAFSDRVIRFVRARSGKSHYGGCREALYGLEPRDVAPDFDDLLAALGLRLRRRALLMFLTNLDDPALAESFVRNIEAVRRRHLVLVSMLRPPGALPLFTDPRADSVDDVYRHLAGHMQWTDLQGIQRVLETRGVGFSLLDDERLCSEIVTQYLNVKQRQLL